MRKKELEDRVERMGSQYDLDKHYFLGQVLLDKQSILSLCRHQKMLLDYLGPEVRHDPERTYLAKKKGKK